MTITASPPKTKVPTTEEKIQRVVDGIRRFSYTTPDEVVNQLKKIVKDEELDRLKKGIIAKAETKNESLTGLEIAQRLAAVEKATDWTGLGSTKRYIELERKFMALFHCESPSWPAIPTLIARKWSLRPVN